MLLGDLPPPSASLLRAFMYQWRLVERQQNKGERKRRRDAIEPWLDLGGEG